MNHKNEVIHAIKLTLKYVLNKYFNAIAREKKDDNIQLWIKQQNDKLKLISSDIIAISIVLWEKNHKFIYLNLTNLSKIENIMINKTWNRNKKSSNLLVPASYLLFHCVSFNLNQCRALLVVTWDLHGDGGWVAFRFWLPT